MGPRGRVAVYYAPHPDDPLFAPAHAWLGRDPANGALVPQPDIPGHRGGHRRAAALRVSCDTEAADAACGRASMVRRCRAAAELAGRTAPFDLPPLAVSDCHRLPGVARNCPVPAPAGTGRCLRRAARSVPSAAVRRRKWRVADGRISRRRRTRMLVRWGYPYVFDTWFFHMTLTRRLTAEEKRVLPAGGGGTSGACARNAATRDRYLPVRSAGSWQTFPHRAAAEAARLSAARNRARPSSSEASFITVSACT